MFKVKQNLSICRENIIYKLTKINKKYDWEFLKTMTNMTILNYTSKLAMQQLFTVTITYSHIKHTTHTKARPMGKEALESFKGRKCNFSLYFPARKVEPLNKKSQPVVDLSLCISDRGPLRPCSLLKPGSHDQSVT